MFRWISPSVYTSYLFTAPLHVQVQFSFFMTFHACIQRKKHAPQPWGSLQRGEEGTRNHDPEVWSGLRTCGQVKSSKCFGHHEEWIFSFHATERHFQGEQKIHNERTQTWDMHRFSHRAYFNLKWCSFGVLQKSGQGWNGRTLFCSDMCVIMFTGRTSDRRGNAFC